MDKNQNMTHDQIRDEALKYYKDRVKKEDIVELYRKNFIMRKTNDPSSPFDKLHFSHITLSLGIMLTQQQGST